jgi:uncharacterized hydrophobic protein (TIGR00271 family)
MLSNRAFFTFINKLTHNFRLFEEKEQYEFVVDSIDKGVVFRGTNLWILVFAIVICSLGLNINSTAVIIGAMLISPLMGPIMGLGLGAAINDLVLLRKSYFNFFFALGVSLAASTLYFLVTPLDDAHSELLARTTPSFYDVLIAFFGGLAGILATSSKMKGNVIPGVAIATALMPPLCTAGYGLATLQWNFFLGALYLFFINSVFIAFATLLTVRYLNFPSKTLVNKEAEKKAKNIITLLVILTLLPSIYFAYDIVMQDRFIKGAQSFIEREAVLPNSYIIKQEIDPDTRTISLTYGGESIGEGTIQLLREKMAFYVDPNTNLELKQGFAFLKDNFKESEVSELTMSLYQKEKELLALREQIDQFKSSQVIGEQLFKELLVYFPDLESALIAPDVHAYGKSGDNGENTMAILTFSEDVADEERQKIQNWFKTRLNTESMRIVIEVTKEE